MDSPRITPATTVAKLAKHALLDIVNARELAVYLRLVALGGRRGALLPVVNSQLGKDVRVIKRALDGLTAHGLIKLHYKRGTHQSWYGRTIEVL